MLAVGGFLLLDCVYLVSVKVTHMGVIVPALMGVALWALALWGAAWQQCLRARPWRLRCWRVALLGLLVWCVSVAAFFAHLHALDTSSPPSQVPQVMVVLGSSTPNGRPSPALAERLKLAYQWAQRYPDMTVVLSGGVDFRQTISEAQAMATYMQALGLNTQRMVLEDRSTSTQENLVFSARVLQARGVTQDAPMLLVTNDFHTMRAGWIAAKAGWTHVHPIGAPTPLYMRYNAWLREYFACISGWLLGEF
jgi:uncharacterized SAM-binding protein YcdF (DUF218 family)